MGRTEAFQILGIDMTKDERAIKAAYREKLPVMNPEDDPEGFKALRGAYEEACRYAREKEDDEGEERPRDTTPSGLWVEKAAEIYGNIHSRQDTGLWKELFNEDIFLSLEEEENCRIKLLVFLMEHFRLPTEVWKLLDRKLSIVNDAKTLRERLSAHFVRYCVGKCERGEDVEFSQFEGAEDADYDLFLQYYDRCWQALQEKKLDNVKEYIQKADGLGIKHPVMEICRANLMLDQGQAEEAIALLEQLRGKYPGDTMICYNAAEILWGLGRKGQAAEMYMELKADNDAHYMANVRLTEWYYIQKEYREAKKCAEKVLYAGGDDYFMDLLCKVNGEIEKELEEKYQESGAWEPALELCWCYLQDGKVSRGIWLAVKIEKLLPPEKETEYNGLLAKLYVEQAEYEDAVTMSQYWEESLKKRLANPESEEKRDRDRLRQAHLIRMQCYHNLGYKDREYFSLAIKEAECVLTGEAKDIGILLEMAQMYTELEEYGQSLEISQKLLDEYQVFAAYAVSLEVYRRQLNARGVVQSAEQCIRYFPGFTKSYEYLAKVYLDLDYREDLEKVLADAEKNGVKSPILDAYKFQMTHKPMETGKLNSVLKAFREKYLKAVENGEKGVYENSLPILTEYLYHYPDDFMLVERAIFHRAAHHYEEAKEDFEKALYINPSNPYALNGLSFVYKYMGDYEKALIFIKKAILYLDKEMSPIIYADMGNLYARLGNYEMALAAYKQYECLAGPENLYNQKKYWFCDNIAACYLRTGRTEEASLVYGHFYDNDNVTYYKKLINLYMKAGEKEKVFQALQEWGSILHVNSAKYAIGFVRRLFFLTMKPKQEIDSYSAYYKSRGWAELVFGDGNAAVKALCRAVNDWGTEGGKEGQLCDAVFACILCGDDKRGEKYGRMLRDCLSKEKSSSHSKYYNRQKEYLYRVFLAAYYTEQPQKVQEILDREEKSEICHLCMSHVCRELESARILFMLRMGQREEAKERLKKNLETQPWDEFMLAVKRVAFPGEM